MESYFASVAQVDRNIFNCTEPILIMLTAEVIPTAKKSNEAAMALQRVGFRILSIGECITITGEKKLFEQFFGIKLLKLSKDILPILPEPAETEFYKPDTQPFIPKEFAHLIREVVFPEPPEFFN